MPFHNAKEIYRGHDEFGVVRVLDDGNKRYLAFGEDDEQSCILIGQPHLPQHDYVKAMMSVMLLAEPRSAVVLGLGGGSIVHSLYQNPNLHITAVDLRQKVIDTAFKYFELPRSPRLNVVCSEADAYVNELALRGGDSRPDLIVSDLYNELGASEVQLLEPFIHACTCALADDGWLVINYWHIHRSRALQLVLDEFFPVVKTLSTNCGNWVIIAGKTPITVAEAVLQHRSRVLTGVYGFSFSSLARKLI